MNLYVTIQNTVYSHDTYQESSQVMLPNVEDFFRPRILRHTDSHHSANEKQLGNVFQIGKMLSRIAVHLKHFLDGRHGSQKDRHVAYQVNDVWVPLTALGTLGLGRIVQIAVDVGGQDGDG